MPDKVWASLPLEVTVRNSVWVDCPCCGGSGMVDDHPDGESQAEECWECEGACGWWVPVPRPEGER